MKSRNPILAVASMMGLTSNLGSLRECSPPSSDPVKYTPSNTPYGYGRPTVSTSPKDFFTNGKHLSNRKLWKRRRKRGYMTSPNKSRRASARKGFRIGRTR